MRVHFADIHGLRTRYYVAGSGPALLLIHGVGSSADTWVRCLELLAERHTVYALDLVGHGFTDSTAFGARSPQEVQLQHLFAFAAAMALERFSIVGASFG